MNKALKNSPDVSIIIPLFNEIEVINTLTKRIEALVERISEEVEVVLVDDGSDDLTPIAIKELAETNHLYQCVLLSRNFGQQKALLAGLKCARGSLIMILDADLQDPPEMFFDFMAKIKLGYEVVYGIRKNRKEGFAKRLAYNGFYKTLNLVSNHYIPKDSGDFCMMTRRVVDSILSSKEESSFLRGLRSWVGFKQIGIGYERQKRIAGVPKYTLFKLLKLANDGLFNFTTLPVKLLIFSGGFCVFISMGYFLITILRKYIYHDVPQGFSALLFVIILFGGLQFLALGILGEYIQRIFFQVKQRPLFIIKSRIINGEQKEQE